MKNFFFLLGAVLFLIIFNSCEQPLEEEEFPYEMKLVIRGILEPDQLIEDIYIGRTLPISVPFDEDFANLQDAVGAVVSDNVFYPLRHTGNGLYTTDSLIARLGNTYSLVVQWQDKSASAQTYIPFPGNVISSELKTFQEDGETIYYVEGRINPRGNESYAASWVLQNLNGEITREAEKFLEVIRSSDGQQIKIRTEEVPLNIISIHNNGSGRLGIRFYIYDEAFYDYYISQGSGQIPDAIFGQPGTAVKWNIKGEGIGMFIGRMYAVRLLP
jgi:hypothetical protein